MSAHVSLKSAAEDKQDATVRKSIPTFMAMPGAIVVVDGFNGRPLDRAHVEVLKAAWRAAKAQGYNPLPPITLRVVGGELQLVDGEHRLTAYTELIAEGEPIERVPCCEFKGDEKAALLYMLGANSGMGWTMLQLGKKYAEAVNIYGMSYAEVATARGMSQQHVRDCINLTEQPEAITGAIESGKIAPAQALKLVKSQGSAEAANTIKAATKAIAEGVRAPKGGKITQKVLDNLGNSKVREMTERGTQAKAHLAAMLESPGFDRTTKDAIRKVMKACGVPVEEAPIDHVGEYLTEASNHQNDLVREAARLLIKHRNNEFVASNQSFEAKHYGRMTWLQELAADGKHKVRSAAAHWMLTVLEAVRSDKEIAPPPSLLSLHEAIEAEISSGREVNAESMCPEHAHLVKYLRTGVV